jgi:nucleoside-diphosphate-sugar epimerase
VEVLKCKFSVVGFDIEGSGNPTDSICGSVTDFDAVKQALKGIGAVVIAHMAPNRPQIYARPEIPYDVNVKGTANLLQASVEMGIKRIVLVSSVSVVDGARSAGQFLSRDLAPSPVKLYGLTKVLQEATAAYFHNRHGLEVAVLRPAYVISGDNLEDKYGVRRPTVNWQAIDPRDIGAAANAALKLPELGNEVFYLMAGPGAAEKVDVAYTQSRLQWEPQYRFEKFPRDL